MKKESKALVILLPIVIVADILLFAATMALSISQTSTLAMWISPFDAFWHSNFIIDICTFNLCIVLTVTALILVAQLIAYRYAGERVARYHKTIATVLTAVFLVATITAIAVPAGQFSYSKEEFDTYAESGSYLEPSEQVAALLPYLEELNTEHGTYGTVDFYHTHRADYVAVYQDSNDKDMRYICEYFRSDSKMLRSKFNAEMMFYPTANAVTGEQNGISYTLFYHHDPPYLSNGEDSERLFHSCEIKLSDEKAAMFLYLFEAEDAVNENTEAILEKAFAQFYLLEEQ